MSILVVCPGCHTRFKVSDRFAGKSGACPKCKAQIQVPGKDEEVKIHVPTEFAGGGRGATGKLALKPIARKQTRFNPVALAAIGGGTLAVLTVAWALGRVGLFQNSLIGCGVGLLLVSPPLVIAGYTFLHDEELEPYQGKSLYVRAGICAVAYVALWGIYSYLAQVYLADVAPNGELWNWVFVAPPLMVMGALAALASLDLDFGNAVFHYCFYVLVTVLLRWAGGMGWLWQSP